jgi:hypothetical protein
MYRYLAIAVVSFRPHAGRRRHIRQDTTAALAAELYNFCVLQGQLPGSYSSSTPLDVAALAGTPLAVLLHTPTACPQLHRLQPQTRVWQGTGC